MSAIHSPESYNGAAAPLEKTKRSITAEDLRRIKLVGDAQFSPNGREILFYLKTYNKKEKTYSNLVSVDLEGVLHEWTQGENSVSQGRWSPDGKWISFVSDRNKPGVQIYALPVGGGEGKQLTNLQEGVIGSYAWSPDSKYIAFTFRATQTEFTGEAKTRREQEGGANPPLIANSVFYRLDGDGVFGDSRFKLYLLDLETLEHREIYAGDGAAGIEFDWHPNSKEVVVAKNVASRPFLDPINVQLFRIPLNGSEPLMVPGKPGGPKRCPRWSPDGASIAYIGHEDANDAWGTRNFHLYVTSVEGGHHRDLMEGSDFDLDVMTLADCKEEQPPFLAWAKDGSGLFVQLGWHGAQELAFVAATGGVTRITEGHHLLGLTSLSVNGAEIAGVYSNASAPPEIVRVQTADGQTATLTSYNAWIQEEIEPARPEELWIESTGGASVHTWILKPTGQGPWPAVIEIHGGPTAQYGWTFFHELQLLTAEGYLVAYSNPRGSKGYGEAHTRAIEKAWGTVDWADIESLTTWLQVQDFVDPGRIGIMGGSYGGYMTNWAIGHSKAYRAAITDRCVSNLVSASGNADFPFNARGTFGGVQYGDLLDIKELWRQSPIAYFKSVTTPTLVIHSEGDLRCNIEQSEQVFSALQALNVPSRFVRYPRETSHGMSRNGPIDLRIHRLNEITRWWRTWL